MNPGRTDVAPLNRSAPPCAPDLASQLRREYRTQAFILGAAGLLIAAAVIALGTLLVWSLR
jgi:predicted nucleic acid-binding protein